MSERLAVRLVDVRRLRPPRAELRLDVRVANDGDEPLWALLPDTLHAEPRAPGGRAWSIAAWRLGELRRAFLLHATGDAGWYAVFVPPHATVTLAALPFAWWGALPDAIDVPVALVTRPRGRRRAGRRAARAEPHGDAGAVGRRRPDRRPRRRAPR